MYLGKKKLKKKDYCKDIYMMYMNVIVIISQKMAKYKKKNEARR